MTRYFSLKEATDDGYEFTHVESKNRFVVKRNDKQLGVAHYRLDGENAIDFNSTFVDPAIRGTGIAKLLAQVSVGDDIVKNRQVSASCWFIDQFLNKNPEFLAAGASF